jgi:hypothetical protein
MNKKRVNIMKKISIFLAMFFIAATMVQAQFNVNSLKIKSSPWVDVTHGDYGAIGNGTHGDAAEIQAALDAAAVTGSEVVLPPGTYLLDDNVIAASNVMVRFMNGAKLTRSASETFTVYSPEHLMVSPRQAITTVDMLRFTTPGTVYPDWWGAAGDGTTNDTTPVSYAFARHGGTASAYGEVKLDHMYAITPIQAESGNVLVTGTGGLKAYIDIDSDYMLKFFSVDNIHIKDIKLDMNHVGGTSAVSWRAALGFYNNDNVIVENCRLINMLSVENDPGDSDDVTTVGISASGITNFNFSLNYIEFDIETSAFQMAIEIINTNSSGLIFGNRIIGGAIDIAANGVIAFANNVSGAGYGKSMGTNESSYDNIFALNYLHDARVGLDGTSISPYGIEGWGQRQLNSLNIIARTSSGGIYSGDKLHNNTGNLIYDTGLYDDTGVGITFSNVGATGANESLAVANILADTGGGSQLSPILVDTTDKAVVASNVFSGNVGGDILDVNGTNTNFTYRGSEEFITLADDATPSVASGRNFLTGGTTTITDFNDGIENQVIYIVSEHSITITDGTNIFLAGSANFVMAATDTLTLICKADGSWIELSRSDN